jgi:hypothetical protein
MLDDRGIRVRFPAGARFPLFPKASGPTLRLTRHLSNGHRVEKEEDVEEGKEGKEQSKGKFVPVLK